MEILGAVLIVYGLFCILIGVLKLPIIWNMKKLRIMAKMFKGERNLQLFVIIWGLIATVVGFMIR
jgi:hypothetical protein